MDWVLVGNTDNWKTALRDNVWGMRDKPVLHGRWERLSRGDRVFFYVKAPISRFIGYGFVEQKFKQDKPLWQDEILAAEVIYPWRFEFKIAYVIEEDHWAGKGLRWDLTFRAGINPMHPEHADQLAAGFDAISGKEIVEEIAPAGTAAEPEPIEPQPVQLSTHEDLKRMLFEVGRIERYVTGYEYRMDGTRLDVVWRRVERSVPTYAFEVQIGGNLVEALGKLKHAYDLWNSNLFLVITEEQRAKANELLSGTFHEIRPRLNIMTVENVQALHGLASKLEALKQRLGLA